MTSEADSQVPTSPERPIPKAMPKTQARRDSGHKECFTTDHLSPIVDAIVVQDFPAILPVGTTPEEAVNLDIPPGSDKVSACVVKVFKECCKTLRQESVDFSGFQ